MLRHHPARVYSVPMVSGVTPTDGAFSTLAGSACRNAAAERSLSTRSMVADDE